MLLRVLLLSMIMAIVIGKHEDIYKHLYGADEDPISLREGLTRLAEGFYEFFKEGERFLANELRDFTPAFNTTYDFVVIGAGTAGATVAARLSEVSNVTVLLIEAGCSENLIMDVPLLVNYLQFNDDINWKYQTEASEDFCRGMVDKRCNWPRGKTMGGSSSLNYMIATRGNRRDYDEWAAWGNQGWSYGELRKYFEKLENIKFKSKRSFFRRRKKRNGPMQISRPPYRTPLAESFVKAGRELGYPTIDYDDRRNIGFSFVHATMQNGTRLSTNRAYLHPAKNRKNLFVSRLSHARRVLINDQGRAYGVEFTKHGFKKIQILASKEVILCAGAVGSPQILMLSGIGPSQHLREMKIPVVKNLPGVGENLMDHISYGGLIFLVNQPVSIRTEDMVDPRKPYLRDFVWRRKGPITIPGAAEALAFLNVNGSKTPMDAPNMELLFFGASMASDLALRNNVGISNECWAKTFSKISGRHTWALVPMLLRPKSRGRILLRSRNHKAPPRIYPNYLSEPEDIKVLIGGIRAAIEVSETKAMQRFKSKLHDFITPGCENFTYRSDEYWECALRTFTCTIYHQSGTCKMGPDSDPMAVVDSKLRVKGITGLRVADASIMPNIVSGHTNIPVIVIGEKLADMVKEYWNYPV